MKKSKSKRIESLNKKRFNKLLRQKKRFGAKVKRTSELFMSRNEELTFSQAKQKALRFILG